MNKQIDFKATVITRYIGLPLSILRGDLVKCLQDLVTETSVLRTYLSKQHDYGCLYQWSDNAQARTQAIELYSALYYEDEQLGREALKAHGIVATDGRGIELAERVNECKANLEVLLEALRKHPEGKKVDAQNELMLENEFAGRSDLYKEVLSRCAKARLHIKQATRPIHIFDPSPKRIGFSWAVQEYSKKVLTYDETKKHIDKAIRLATARHETYVLETLIRDRDVFMRMPKQAEFVKQLPQAPHVIASVNGRKYRASMPFLINYDNGGWPEAIGNIQEKYNDNPLRMLRKDRTIADRALVEQLGIYLRIRNDRTK
jgi:hypothetical protein